MLLQPLPVVQHQPAGLAKVPQPVHQPKVHPQHARAGEGRTADLAELWAGAMVHEGAWHRCDG